jgi:hypothetical protein
MKTYEELFSPLYQAALLEAWRTVLQIHASEVLRDRTLERTQADLARVAVSLARALVAAAEKDEAA